MIIHRKKRFTSIPSPAGISLTKLRLGRNNSVMTSLFPPRESLVVTSRLGTGNSRTFFLRCSELWGWSLEWWRGPLSCLAWGMRHEAWGMRHDLYLDRTVCTACPRRGCSAVRFWQFQLLVCCTPQCTCTYNTIITYGGWISTHAAHIQLFS
jgi:hypothetical protein